MKKLLLVLFVLLLSLTACSKKEQETETPSGEVITTPTGETGTTGGSVGVAWQHKEFNSLEEMNAVLNTNITKAPLENVTNEKYMIIGDDLAQYTFNVEDEEWCVRASDNVDSDISGLYYDSISFEKDTTSSYYTDDYYLFRFFFEDKQYVITLDVKDLDVSDVYFSIVAHDFKTAITGIESGTSFELTEEGDDIVYTYTLHNEDGTKIVSRTVYSYQNDKMVSIITTTTFETAELLQDYLDLLKEYEISTDDLIIEGNSMISHDSSGSLEFYSEYSKEEFYNMMKESIFQ